MENKIQKWPVHHSKQGVWSTGGVGVHSDDDFYVEVEASDREEAQEKGQQIFLSGGNNQAVEHRLAADVTTCAEIGWHDWHNGVCLRCGEREYNPSRG
jgi:hypothetical protein